METTRGEPVQGIGIHFGPVAGRGTDRRAGGSGSLGRLHFIHSITILCPHLLLPSLTLGSSVSNEAQARMPSFGLN